MAVLRITQIKSKNGCTERQKATLYALGLRKMNSTVEVEGTEQVKGMVAKVNHLVCVEEI